MDETRGYIPEGAEDFRARATNGTEGNEQNGSVEPSSPGDGLAPIPNSLTTREFDQQPFDGASELTPEIVRAILDKVKDVNEVGTAFTTLRYLEENGTLDTGTLKDVLELGLLGVQTEEGATAEERVAAWKRNVEARDIDRSKIWFNIVGRMSFEYEPWKHHLMPGIKGGYHGVKLVFSLKNFEEMAPGRIRHADPTPGTREERARMNKRFSGNPQGKGTGTVQYYFERSIHGARGSTTKFQSHHKEWEDTGFITPYRISPRFFEGLVLGEQEQPFLKVIVTAMLDANRERPDRLIPVYDDSGNLLWPVRMSAEEIKRLAA